MRLRSALVAGLAVVATLAGGGVMAEPAGERQGNLPSQGNAPAQGAWPRTLPEAEAEAKAKAVPEPPWPQQEIDLARARCNQLLKSVNVVAVPEPAFRHGECGAPAPIRLVSVGRNPEVAISPPALVTCDMAAALGTWIKNDLQPLARKHLGSQIVKIEGMSDYSCRNAYGRVRTRLSEHGRANALDIRGFMSQVGQMVTVLDDWGMTGREIAAAVAAEKAAAARAAAAAEAAARQAAAVGPAKAGGQPAAVGTDGLNRRTLVEGLPRVTIVPGGGEAGGEAHTGFSMTPSRLGGPKPQPPRKRAAPTQPAPARMAGAEERSSFVRKAHESACRIFGTVLGPEANNAHRNHLHVDMADRSTGAFCE